MYVCVLIVNKDYVEFAHSNEFYVAYNGLCSTNICLELHFFFQLNLNEDRYGNCGTMRFSSDAREDIRKVVQK